MREAVTLSESTKLRLTMLFGFVGLMHLIAWATLLFVVAPRYPQMIGLGLLAYTLGLRHAFDADHIAAIDNTTRKFMQEGKKQLGVGFFFSLGHAAIVAVMALLLALATTTVQEEFPTLQGIGGIISTSVSGIFLYLIGILNLIVLIDIIRIFKEMRSSRYDTESLEQLLMSRGLMSRFFRPLFRIIGSSWQMFPIGFLFGLGFDTASEVALLALSAEAATNGLPITAIIVLPLLFASGMCLMDTADGVFMAQAYDWAFSNPIRKIYYNITVTGLSVAVALLIGTIELLQVSIDQFGLAGGFWDYISNLDFGPLGYIVVAMFIVAWAISYFIWKFGRVDERWSGEGLTGSERRRE